MLSSNTSAANGAANYIEDVFSTWLYNGNSSTQTITNGIDLSTKGGLVWQKSRSNGTYSHRLTDTVRGAGYGLSSNNTNASTSSSSSDVTGFTSSGFNLGYIIGDTNLSGETYASWTFRKQPKFFDIQTITHTSGTANTVDLSGLGTVGCVIVKQINGAQDWFVWHRSLTAGNLLYLNGTVGQTADNNISVSGTTLTMASGASTGTYIVYAYAHNAGGFGLTGTDNVISCGSFTASGSGTATINLGYEPQWLLYKPTTGAADWIMFDTMRGFSNAATDARLWPNLSTAEDNAYNYGAPTATGMNLVNVNANEPYIYIAIRRGPMKVPTDATKVFKPVAATPSGSQDTVTTGFPTDFIITTERSHSLTGQTFAFDRLRGGTTTQRVYLTTNNTNAETNAGGGSFGLDSNVAVYDNFYQYSGITNPVIYWNFKRAPSFFDEVCYSGTGSARTVTHNLGVAPEMMLIKRRDTSAQWQFYFAALGNTKSVQMPDNDKVTSSGLFNNTSPTSSVFTVGVNSPVNASGGTYVSYLAATCAGVSKVGTYTGTGAAQQINCGFTAGARFVLIKNVGVNDYAYGYYLWDSARGIVSGNDPYLLLSSTAAEVTSTDYIDPLSTGFEISSTAPAGINANGDQFVYWAIA